METVTFETIVVNVPTQELRLFKALCKKMGWKNRKRRKKTVPVDEPA